MLSLLIFLPLLAIVPTLLLPSKQVYIAKYIGIVVASVQLFICFGLFSYTGSVQSYAAGFTHVVQLPWIHIAAGTFGAIDIQYFIGVDGIGKVMLLLSALVMLIALAASWEIKDKQKGFHALLLLLNASVMGVFCALDFVLFYVFYEFMLLPLYFLIGIWGGARREYAAIKFFLYTLLGSIFMLLVIIGLYFASNINGQHTFNMLLLADIKNYSIDGLISPGSQVMLGAFFLRHIAFWAMFIAFAIKIPIVPLHTWLPDAHVEAPTPISIILAGILLKVGAYGIIRCSYAIFPDVATQYSYTIGLIGVISILYGAFCALAANDLKRMVAYSSVSHMGFVLLGIASCTPQGMGGAVLQIISHGILSSMLFFMVGMLYNRVHVRDINQFRGLAQQQPIFTAFVTVGFFASLGLPAFSAFPAEFLSITGAFLAVGHHYPIWFAIIAIAGIVLGAAYFLWTLQRMFFGTLRLKGGDAWLPLLTEPNGREWAVLLTISVLSVYLGLAPGKLLQLTESAVMNLVALVR